MDAQWFPMRGGFAPDLAYERTAIFASRGIAEVPDPSDGYASEELELLHRRQIAKKNADLHGRALDLPARVRTRYALQVVERWFDPNIAEALLERSIELGTRDETGVLRVSVMPPIKASFNKNINFLCYVYAAALARALADLAASRRLSQVRFVIDPNLALTQYGGTRTESGAIGRLARQSVQRALIEPGRNVILVDDHAEACSILAVAHDAVARAGANLIGISVLSAIPDARNIRVHPAIEQALLGLLGPADSLDEALAPAGLRVATLTSREALLTYAFLADPADSAQRERFFSLLEIAGHDSAIAEGQYGSLRGAFDAAPMSLAELAQAIREEATSNRIDLLLPGQILARRPCLSPDAFLAELEAGAPNLFVKGPDFPRCESASPLYDDSAWPKL